uniref:Uncharacterized protein n=1 Tax=Anguilla anguilla TaxID=7936 RepID=A0A0E9WP54_ANGAN
MTTVDIIPLLLYIQVCSLCTKRFIGCSFVMSCSVFPFFFFFNLLYTSYIRIGRVPAYWAGACPIAE